MVVAEGDRGAVVDQETLDALQEAEVGVPKRGNEDAQHNHGDSGALSWVALHATAELRY